MVGIDYYFPGYRVVRVVEDDLSKCVGILLKYSMRARVDSDGKIYLKESDVEKFRTHARGIDYSISDTVGLIRCVRWIRHRYATIVAIILSVALIVCSSSIVWDVRISGEYDIPEANLIDGLREAGLTVGMRWSAVDKGQIENKFLALNSNIGWININRRGTVAYVSLVPRGETPVPQINKGVSNIVADRDAVIEEITVYSGKAMVKVGDEVKAGDILISGEVQVGDTAISCRADGIVRGVVSDTVRTQIHSFSDQTYVKNNGVARVSINFLILR